jgi:hypothetical protein
MFYYISTNSWNLLESFVSESISPFSFYQVRGYGNNLSRYLDGTNERANYLILSTKEINGDYVSCSPYRVPIARLAAAQAALRNK